VNAVSANHKVGIGGRVIVEFHLNLFRLLDETNASMVKVKHVVWQRGGEDLKQIGAMKMVVRRAKVSLVKIG